MRSHTLVLALVLCIGYAAAENREALKAVADGSARFATNFFKVIAKEKKNENLICSALSAHVVLSMAAYGAGGSTAVEMRRSLYLPSEDTLGLQGFENLIDELNTVKNVTLEVANKIYVAKSFEVKSEYKQLTSGNFRSETDALDIEHPEEAVNAVNSWADQKTHGKIKSILKNGDVTKDTRLILLNAIYFKGKWADKFHKRDTEDKPFYWMENGLLKEKNVPTMYKIDSFFYGELPELKARFIELPYENDDLKMVIIVPDEIDGLSKIEENLESFDYNRLQEVGSHRNVHLYLPKFKIETTMELNEPLKKLGMSEMFTNAANFSGIATTPLKVDSVIQKAYIEVNEEGSEAAAVTAIFGVAASAWIPEKYYSLNVDRPSYFAIFSDSNKVTLFQGKISRL